MIYNIVLITLHWIQGVVCSNSLYCIYLSGHTVFIRW